MTSAASDRRIDGVAKARAILVMTFDDKLTPAARKVGVLLLRHFNLNTRRCDPGIERIARVIGCDRSTVFRALNNLIARGYIRRHRHQGQAGTNVYVPNWELLLVKADLFDNAFAKGQAFTTAPANDDQVATGGQVAETQPATSQFSDSTRRSHATQKPERNLEEKFGSAACSPETTSPDTDIEGLPRKGEAEPHRPNAQRSFMLRISGGTTYSARTMASTVARQKASQRLWEDLRRLVPDTVQFAAVVAAMTPVDEEIGLEAEMARKNSGALRLVQAMHAAAKGGGDGTRTAA